MRPLLTAEDPGYRLWTEDEARAWVLELVAEVEAARAACDGQVLARDAQRTWAVWLTKHGAALGTVMALHRAGFLGDVAYNALRERVLATLRPTVLEVGNG